MVSAHFHPFRVYSSSPTDRPLTELPFALLVILLVLVDHWHAALLSMERNQCVVLSQAVAPRGKSRLLLTLGECNLTVPSHLLHRKGPLVLQSRVQMGAVPPAKSASASVLQRTVRKLGFPYVLVAPTTVAVRRLFFLYYNTKLTK
jgi:hypothetical protein